MKRLLCLFLVLLMSAVCLLSACDDGSDAESKTDTDLSGIASGGDSSAESLESSDSSDESSVDDESSEDTESSDDAEPSDDVESSDDTSDDTSGDTSGDDGIKEIEVLFSRYTQQPYFVMIGTCSMGATVTATQGSQSVSVPSYMGWFELTLNNADYSDTLEVSFTQSVDGSVIGESKTVSVKPIFPPNKGTKAIGSNGAFQFFLEKMVPDFKGGNLYADNVIKSMQERVKERIKKLNQYNRGAEIIYMIVPSPMTIYPELVPEYYTQGKGETRLDQVTDALTDAGATVIDLRDTFTEHKNDRMPLYYKLDSHWADYGAYLAYVELFDHISKTFTHAKPRGIDEFTWTEDYYISADACLYLDIPQPEVYEYGYFREFAFDDPCNITSVPRYRGKQLIYNDLTTEEKTFFTGNYTLPNCIVYRDSYCAGIYDLIPERMNKTHYVGMWNYAWQNWLIDQETPNYVIYVIAEWNMNEIVYN